MTTPLSPEDDRPLYPSADVMTAFREHVYEHRRGLSPADAKLLLAAYEALLAELELLRGPTEEGNLGRPEIRAARYYQERNHYRAESAEHRTRTTLLEGEVARPERDEHGHYPGCYTVGCAATRCMDLRAFWEAQRLKEKP